MKSRERIGLLQEKLKEEQLGGALLSYSRDVFYYTGTAQPSYLVVLPDDYILFVRSGLNFKGYFRDSNLLISLRLFWNREKEKTLRRSTGSKRLVK